MCKNEQLEPQVKQHIKTHYPKYSEFIAFPWPDYQEYMAEDWFLEECYYCNDSDIYFIPKERVIKI